MRRGSPIPAALLALLAALSFACGTHDATSRKAAVPDVPPAPAPAGPRYVCEYNPDPAGLPECELESKFFADRPRRR